ncbi:MAG: YidC/Oxa1 family membrane protein insertase [Coriobacteriia bacterium]|nr:YidC/Oxa1 family membrane protein insertase [Coriobacteriia bacterium]
MTKEVPCPVWNAVKDMIFAALQSLHDVTGDYGASIILITILMRVALTPLTLKQTRSMYEMQRIQPKIKELQQKYKGDKEKLQEETLKFYQDNKVNPFGGCLPLILQMPIFIALFQVLGGTAEHPGRLLAYLESLPAAEQAAAKAFWIFLPDITVTPGGMYAVGGLVAALPYLALVVLFGLSIWLPQQLMPGENQQKQVGLIMAVMMLYFGWVSPAGVLLYWVTSSVLGLIQQQLQIRFYSRSEGAQE